MTADQKSMNAAIVKPAAADANVADGIAVPGVIVVPDVVSAPPSRPLSRRLTMSALRIAAGVAFIYMVAVVLLFYYHPRLIYHPSRNIPVTPGDIGAIYTDLWLTTPDGVKINAWRVPAMPQTACGLTLLMFHGNAGNLHSIMPSSLMFRNMGFDFFAIDYHGFGKSGGEPSEEAIYQDAEAAWNYLTGTRGVPPGQIVILGRSLGGGPAAWLAERHPEAGGLILESTFTSLGDAAANLMPLFPARLIVGKQFETLGRMANIRMPLLVVHGDGDRLIPFSHG